LLHLNLICQALQPLYQSHFAEKAVKRAGLDYWQHVDLSVYEDWNSFVQSGNTKNRVYFSKFGTENLLDYRFAQGPQVPGDGLQVTLVFGSESRGLFDLIGKEAMDGPTLALPNLVLP
jgi:tRNA(Leu) C34 or U34 (ribose-2'-O)-methylase TrmL